MPSFYVYMLITKKDNLYTGISTDPERRLIQHNRGRGAKCLRGQLPAELLWSSKVMNKSAALKEEARIKKLSKELKLAFLLGETAKRSMKPQLGVWR
jgi:putative endonuclease